VDKQKDNQTLKLFLHLKNVSLTKLDWVLIHTARRDQFQSHFQASLKKQPIELSKQPVVLCFYCMKRGHFVRFCRVRKVFVPKGILKWYPKVSKVPTNIIGPKFIRGPNLAS